MNTNAYPSYKISVNLCYEITIVNIIKYNKTVQNKDSKNLSPE